MTDDYRDFVLKNSIDLELEKDPKEWMQRGDEFRMTAKYLSKEYMESMFEDNGETLPAKHPMLWASVPFIYIVATTLEIYLKGYLIAKGLKIEEVRKFQHDIEKVRKKCSEYNLKFDKGTLPYITTNYGKLILENGGMRYPNRKAIPLLFPDYVDIMDEIRDELSNEINLMK